MLASSIRKSFAQVPRLQTIRTFATAEKKEPYVWVNKYTTVICQGFTGKQVGKNPILTTNKIL
jgi:hypothetical protein